MAAQVGIEEKREMADVVIDNTGDWQATASQVEALFQTWKGG